MITQEDIDGMTSIDAMPEGANHTQRGDWYAVWADDMMNKLVSWAMAYEAGDELVNNTIYDGTVAALKDFMEEFPSHFAMLLDKHSQFRDGRWLMTGNFWRS